MLIYFHNKKQKLTKMFYQFRQAKSLNQKLKQPNIKQL